MVWQALANILALAVANTALGVGAHTLMCADAGGAGGVGLAEAPEVLKVGLTSGCAD